ENPWDTFETIFTEGSVHQCTIQAKTDKGAVLELPYGVEGFCNTKNLVKADGSQPEVGETLDFKVIEFVKGEKKIVLSHVATYAEEKKEKKSKTKEKEQETDTNVTLETLPAETLADTAVVEETKKKRGRKKKSETESSGENPAL
ncbi:MAG: S1 RNA-binding domain-containing protein, partial [Raineya sp.]|nr:S1 RNA-binding domain-containing protein [Raineya sp.]